MLLNEVKPTPKALRVLQRWFFRWIFDSSFVRWFFFGCCFAWGECCICVNSRSLGRQCSRLDLVWFEQGRLFENESIFHLWKRKINFNISKSSMKKHPQIKVPISSSFSTNLMVLSDAFGYIQTIHPPFLKVPFSSSGAGLSTSWVWDFSDVGDQIQCEQLEVCVELSSLTTCSRRTFRLWKVGGISSLF